MKRITELLEEILIVLIKIGEVLTEIKNNRNR